MDLKGRNFLTLKDFTPEEITYLIDLSAEVKEKKKQGVPVDNYKGKNVALIFEKDSTRTRCAFEWLPMIWEWELHTSDRRDPRWERKRVLRIPQGYWEGCSMESSIVDSDRKSWRNSRNMQACLCGTV